MKTTIHLETGDIQINLNQFYDLSIAISPTGPRAWYVNPVVIKPVINRFLQEAFNSEDRSIFEIFFLIHMATAHIPNVLDTFQKEWINVNEELKSFFFLANVITVEPSISEVSKGYTQVGDRLITQSQLEKMIGEKRTEAVVIRTKPNDRSKLNSNYSDTNFCYLEADALAWLAQIGVKHLLLDLPSVDRESDGGELLGHRAFWSYPQATRRDCTITEMIYVPDEAVDGIYFMNLQVAAFDNDASPSRPLLFPIL